MSIARHLGFVCALGLCVIACSAAFTADVSSGTVADCRSTAFSAVDHVLIEWTVSSPGDGDAVTDHVRFWAADGRRRVEYERTENTKTTIRWVSVTGPDGSRKFDVLTKKLNIVSAHMTFLPWTPPPFVGFAAFMPCFTDVKPYFLYQDPLKGGGLDIDPKSVERQPDGLLTVHTEDRFAAPHGATDRTERVSKREIRFSPGLAPKWRIEVLAGDTDHKLHLITAAEIATMIDVDDGTGAKISIPESGTFIEYDLSSLQPKVIDTWTWKLLKWDTKPQIDDDLFELPTHLADEVLVNWKLPKKTE